VVGADGVIFGDVTGLAEAWREFAERKFAATEREALRGALPEIGCRGVQDPSGEDLQFCLDAMRKSKAVGMDGFPIEVFKASAVARRQLFRLIRIWWRGEEVPEDLVVGLFVCIYKDNGSTNAFTKYRFICLLNHMFKLLSAYLLLEFVRIVDGLFPDTQAGFRKGRSTADNLFLLAALIDEVLETSGSCVLVFVDFVVAFDSVSHHFLDEAMGHAEQQLIDSGRESEIPMLRKCRAVFRAIYDRASACVRVADASGSKVNSKRFNLCRGVVQGDIFSPVAFIFALAVVMLRHGGRVGGDGSELDVLFNKLADLLYADDDALVDESTGAAEERLNKLARGAEQDADMEISLPKTEVMHVKAQVPVSPVTKQDYRNITECKAPVLGFRCEFCGDGFDTRQGLRQHRSMHCAEARRGVHSQDYAVEAVLDARGFPEFRYYLVKWAGWSSEHSTWEPWRHVEGAEGAVEAFFEQSGLDRNSVIQVVGEHRCEFCNQLFTSMRAAATLKAHLTRKKGGCEFKPRSRVGSRAERAVVQWKVERAQGKEERVHLGGCELKNVYKFKYLGQFFTADGNKRYAVEVRMGQARARFGRLARIWESSVFPLAAKLRLFEAGVVSVLVYGCESWHLDDKQMVALKHWCTKCMVRLTDRGFSDENRDPTYPLVVKVRQRRFRWLGHVLRLEEDRLVRTAVLQLVQKCLEGESADGTILMDAPAHGSVEELLELANDKQLWNGVCNAMCPKLKTGRPPRRAKTGEAEGSKIEHNTL
jgi:hypothetical protein